MKIKDNSLNSSVFKYQSSIVFIVGISLFCIPVRTDAQGASGGGFSNATYTENKFDFTLNVDWDGDLNTIAPEGLFISNTGILSNDGSVATGFIPCPEKNPDFCWDFALNITDSQTGNFPLGIFGQHKIEADPQDTRPEGDPVSNTFVRNFSFTNPVNQVLPATGLQEILLFEELAEHPAAPTPHTDLYRLFYKRPELNNDITFIFKGVHCPASSPEQRSSTSQVCSVCGTEPCKIPEPSSTLSLLALGTLGAASAVKRKQNQKSTEKETTKVG